MKKNCLLCAVCARKVKKKVLNEEKYLPKQILFHLPMKVSNYIFFEPLVGFEPTTPRLQITCSGQLS